MEGLHEREEMAAILLSRPCDGIPPTGLGRFRYNTIIDGKRQVVLAFQ